MRCLDPTLSLQEEVTTWLGTLIRFRKKQGSPGKLYTWETLLSPTNCVSSYHHQEWGTLVGDPRRGKRAPSKTVNSDKLLVLHSVSAHTRLSTSIGRLAISVFSLSSLPLPKFTSLMRLHSDRTEQIPRDSIELKMLPRQDYQRRLLSLRLH